MFLASSCSCFSPIQWSQVLSREWMTVDAPTTSEWSTILLHIRVPLILEGLRYLSKGVQWVLVFVEQLLTHCSNRLWSTRMRTNVMAICVQMFLCVSLVLLCGQSHFTIVIDHTVLNVTVGLACHCQQACQDTLLIGNIIKHHICTACYQRYLPVVTKHIMWPFICSTLSVGWDTKANAHFYRYLYGI